MSQRNSSLRTGLAAVLLLACALALFRYVVYRPAATGSAPARAASTMPAGVAHEAVVLSVSGEVQKSQGGSWATLAAGEKLGENAELRTGKGARTDIRVGAHDRVTLSGSSDLIIKDLTQEVRRLRLMRGLLAVDGQDPDAPPLRVEDETGSAVAAGRKARFSVLSTGTGIAVATEKGQVALTSNHRTVSVSAGMESLAMHGQTPQAPRPISRKILMQVANAVIGASAEVCADLAGVVPAGAEMFIDGIRTEPDAEGRFRVKVPRERGRRSALLELRDASGRSKTREVPCAPSQGEVKDVAIKWRENP